MIKHHTFRLALFATVLSLFLTGCGQKSPGSDPQAQEMEGTQQGDKIPEQLIKLEASIEKIIKDLNGPAVEIQQEKGDEYGKKDEESSNMESTSGESSGSGGTSDTKNSSGEESKDSDKSQTGEDENKKDSGQKQEESKKEGGQNKQQEQSLKKEPLDTIFPTINSLHYQWNGYMPMAVKKGANNVLVENFSKSLNRLTSTALENNSTKTLLAANSLYGHVPDLYSLYKTSVSPEIKRIRYYIRNAMLCSISSDWQTVQKDMASLKSSWALYKNTLDKEQQSDSNMLDFSISELDKVIQEKSGTLISIKGKIALSNVESLEKAVNKKVNSEAGQGSVQ